MERKKTLGRVSAVLPNIVIQRTSKKYTEEEIDDLYKEIETHDHVIPIRRLCDKLNTSSNTGLTPQQAAVVSHFSLSQCQ